MPDNNAISNIALKTAKIVITLSSIFVPALVPLALIPDYISEFLSEYGILDVPTNEKLQKQLKTVIRNTITRTKKELTIGNYRGLVKLVQAKLNYKLHNLNIVDMTLGSYDALFNEVYNDKSIWEDKYFSSSDISNIAGTFYNIFKTETLKFPELRSYVMMETIDILRLELKSLEIKVFNHNNDINALKKLSSGWITKGNQSDQLRINMSMEDLSLSSKELLSNAKKIGGWFYHVHIQNAILPGINTNLIDINVNINETETVSLKKSLVPCNT